MTHFFKIPANQLRKLIDFASKKKMFLEIEEHLDNGYSICSLRCGGDDYAEFCFNGSRYDGLLLLGPDVHIKTVNE